MFDTIFDFATITLLAITIVYSWKLNQKLASLANPKSEIASNLQTFSTATESAVVAVEELHVKGEEVCKIIDEKIRKAQLLADEMEFLTIRANRKVAEIKQVSPAQAQRGVANSVAELQLLKALKEREYQDALLG